MLVNIPKEIAFEECPSCGIIFGLSLTLQKRLVKNQNTFYCPSGHGQSYFGETVEERLRKDIKDLQIRNSQISIELAAFKSKPKRKK